ncbi:MAG: hypothetical protein ACXAD7_04255, partial [Candidatus Kariarchaeaceae archaeon]
IDEAIKVNQRNIPFVVVGNKTDLYEQTSLDEIRPVIDEMIEDLTYYVKGKLIYIESSALLGENIDEIFENLIGEMQIKSTDSVDAPHLQEKK